MSNHDKDNYDWMADFSSAGKGFYDLDHDGHIDAFEAGLMMSDIDEEIKEFERSGGGYTPSSGTGSTGTGCGCLTTFLVSVILALILKLLGF